MPHHRQSMRDGAGPPLTRPAYDGMRRVGTIVPSRVAPQIRVYLSQRSFILIAGIFLCSDMAEGGFYVSQLK